MIVQLIDVTKILSPPTFMAFASLSVITPFEVERMAMPNPFNTFGSGIGRLVLTQSWRLTRASLVIADSFGFRVILHASDVALLVGGILELVVQDVSLVNNTFVTSFFRYEAGTSAPRDGEP